jgi:hypothetical protein
MNITSRFPKRQHLDFLARHRNTPISVSQTIPGLNTRNIIDDRLRFGAGLWAHLTTVENFRFAACAVAYANSPVVAEKEVTLYTEKFPFHEALALYQTYMRAGRMNA